MCSLKYSILLFFSCVSLFAQQKTPSSRPEKHTERRTEPLGESLQKLGKSLEQTCETVVAELEDEKTWQPLTLQLAGLGNDLRRLVDTHAPHVPQRSTPPDSVCAPYTNWGDFEKMKKFSKVFA